MRARIATFKVEITTVDEQLQSATVRLPHRDGIQYSATWSEAELQQWVWSTIREYLQAQTRAAAQAARARTRRLRESH